MKSTILSSMLATSLLTAVSSHGAIPIPTDCLTGGFAVGCQAWTFNQFSVFEAIEITALCGGKVIELFPGQKLSPEQPEVRFDQNAPDEVLAKVKEQLAKYNVVLVNYGVVGVPSNEAEARKLFEFAKKMHLRAITTESVESMDLIERLAREYDIMVGFHNHPRQPNNPNYKVWDPSYIKQVLEGRDPRLGAAADTGHWARSGLDPVECLKVLDGRIVSVHLKDLSEKGKTDAHDVPYGTGINEIPETLNELRRQGFQGNISIEYEFNWDNNMPQVGQCIGFVRGYGQENP